VVAKLQGGGVTLTNVTGKRGMEQLLAETHKTKYSQCVNTPMVQSPLRDDFGYLGVDKAAAQAVLDGTYHPPEGADEYACQLLKELAMSDIALAAKETPDGIPVDTWRKFWSKAKERTVSGPSAINFSVLKAGAHSDLIATFDAVMTEIPILLGYFPERWRKAIDAVLIKKAGVFLANKLMTIVLFEADFNYLNKHVGRTMIRSAQIFGHLAREQYGSRQGHKAIDQATNKQLTTDLLLLLREPGVVLSQDASGCYDRINHAVGGILMERQKAPKPTIICMFTTLQDLEHNIRTAYGNSSITYGGNLWVVPLQGIGQGNGAGPPLWAIVSLPLLEMLRTAGFGTFFQKTISGKKVSYVGFSFVDDTNQVQTGCFPGEDCNSIAEQMQLAVNKWEGGLCATGGALDPKKLHWYLINFIWQFGKWRMARKDEHIAEILIRDSTGEKISIDRLKVDEAWTTLGVDQCPSGNMDQQAEKMEDLTRTWAAQMKTGYLKRPEMWLSLTSTIWMSLEYPLNATTLSKAQCEAIMAPALTVGLNGLGICQNLPRKLVHGPVEKQGLEGYPICIQFKGFLSTWKT
jgi:hypothetical protein